MAAGETASWDETYQTALAALDHRTPVQNLAALFAGLTGEMCDPGRYARARQLARGLAKITTYILPDTQWAKTRIWLGVARDICRHKGETEKMAHYDMISAMLRRSHPVADDESSEISPDVAPFETLLQLRIDGGEMTEEALDALDASLFRLEGNPEASVVQRLVLRPTMRWTWLNEAGITQRAASAGTTRHASIINAY